MRTLNLSLLWDPVHLTGMGQLLFHKGKAWDKNFLRYPWDEHFFKNELQFSTQEEQLISLNIFYLKKNNHLGGSYSHYYPKLCDLLSLTYTKIL